jgi:hypothetical protein
MQLKSITAILVLSLVVASLLVSGCTSSQNTNTAPSAGGSAGGGLSFSAYQVPISANDLAYGFYSEAAAQGYTYVGFYCTLTNSGASTYATNVVILTLTTTTGTYTSSPYIYQKGEFPTGAISLGNGQVVNGVALFQVPTGTTGFTSITYSDGPNNLVANL